MIQRSNTEILAPVGSEEMLRAAVLSGADAVYLGLPDFNARRNAQNFTDEQLKNAIEYCHKRGVKVHITLNTLIKDTELSTAVEAVKKIALLGADAVIVQDLGVAKLINAICPQLEMHASTQLSTGTSKGLIELKKLGFTRAVLPRELSLSEIEELCKSSPIDLEVFIHGALCMCVSGQCLMSAVLGSRSGNRGLCAQPCRLPFKVPDGTGHDLSLKDLSLIEHIPRLMELGVCSFKIEGRMKRPEYVSAAVTACKAAAENRYSPAVQADLEALFSRSGFTDGYYKDALGRNMFGCREKENVQSATKELLKKYEAVYEKEKPRYKIKFTFSGQIGERASLKAELGENSVTVFSDALCEAPINRPISSERIRDALSKCGGTQFDAENVEIDGEIDYSLPVSALNAMRRSALEQLERKISSLGEIKTFPAPVPTDARSDNLRKIYCRFDSVEQIPESFGYFGFVPVEEYNKCKHKESLGVELPHGMFGNSEKVEKLLTECPAEKVLCHTLDGIALAKKQGKKVVASPSMNIINSLSMDKAREIGINEVIISNECTLDNFSKISSPVSKGITVYGRLPLMLTRNCPVKNGKTCSECKRNSSITDRKGISFPVRCRMGYSEILNSRPVYMGDKMREIPPCDILFFNFTVESKAEVERILQAYKNEEKPRGEFTRGLLYRGVE